MYLKKNYISKDIALILQKIVKKLRNEISQRANLYKNINFLLILHIFNYISPLITIAYLIRTIGPEKYGHLAFVSAFTMYFIIFSDFGFKLYAPKKVSIDRDDLGKLSSIFSSVIFIKSILTVVSFLVIVLLIFFIDDFRREWKIFIFYSLTLIGYAIWPVWFFQGLEKMSYITRITIFYRIISIFLIILLVKKEEDYYLVPLIDSMLLIIVALVSIRSLNKLGIKFQIPEISQISYYVKESKEMFLSTFFINLYTNSNRFILGLLSNKNSVSYYVMAEEIIKGVVSLIYPVSNAIYPYISRMFSISKEEAIEFARYILYVIFIIMLLLSLAVFIFSPLIVRAIYGESFEQVILVLKILSFLPLIIGISNILGIQLMLPLNYKKAFFLITTFGGLFNIIISIFLIIYIDYIGLAISVLLTEALITVSMWIFLSKKQVSLIRR